MKVILSGGGSGEQTKEIDEYFAKLVDKTKKLLYIPIAIDSCKHPYPECLKWLKDTFDNLGIKEYEMVTEDTLNNLAKQSPANYGGIYVGGGNTPYLLKKLKESGAWNFLKDALDKNIPIYGGSAGAIIFSKSIKPSLSFDKNWIELKDLDGMNIVRNYFLFCHFSPDREEKIMNVISKEKTSPAILLPETQGLYVTEKEIKLIGTDNAWIVEKGNKKEFNLK